MTMTLPEMRNRAAGLGMANVKELDRFQLAQRLAKHDQEVNDLRQACASKGLPTEGEKADLELRLTEHATGISAQDRKLYTWTAYTVIGLGIAGLLVSIPHIATGLGRLMGVHPIYAALLALIIDGGICALKVVDSLGTKFELRNTRKAAQGLLVACLAFSAALNAFEFCQHVETVGAILMANVAALFLSGFVFATFYAGSNMLLRMSPKCNSEPKSVAAIFDDAKAKYLHLTDAAKVVGQ